MKTYHKSAHWRAYQALLSKEFGVDIRQEPEELWMERRGHNLHVDEWVPKTAPRGTVILVHGGGGNGRILSPYADIFVRDGWRVLAPDLPGYGLTIPSAEFGWNYAEWPATVAALADEQEGPVFLMGLSMGGLTALYAAQQSQNVDGVIATTLLDPSVDSQLVAAARAPWLGWLTLFGIRYAPWLMDRVWMPLNIAVAMKDMSSNRAMARFFQTDKLLGRRWAPARFFRSVHEFKRDSLDLACPLLLAHPGADEWTPLALSLTAFERVSSPKELVELDGGSHLILEQPALSQLEAACLSFVDRLVSPRQAVASIG